MEKPRGETYTEKYNSIHNTTKNKIPTTISRFLIQITIMKKKTLQQYNDQIKTTCKSYKIEFMFLVFPATNQRLLKKSIKYERELTEQCSW